MVPILHPGCGLQHVIEWFAAERECGSVEHQVLVLCWENRGLSAPSWEKDAVEG